VDEPVRLSTRTDGTFRVELRGEVDFATADTLRESIRDALDRAKPALVLLDLGKVTFIDSSGMALLLAVRRAAGRNGCGCRVERANDMVLSRLEVAGLAHVFGLSTEARRLRRSHAG
jgi:anti-sigma B factor antagonist